MTYIIVFWLGFVTRFHCSAWGFIMNSPFHGEMWCWRDRGWDDGPGPCPRGRHSPRKWSGSKTPWDRGSQVQSGNRRDPGRGYVTYFWHENLPRESPGDRQWSEHIYCDCAAAEREKMALARTGNVNSNELYTFFTNDTNAFNNIVSITGQVTNTFWRWNEWIEELWALIDKGWPA